MRLVLALVLLATGSASAASDSPSPLAERGGNEGMIQVEGGAYTPFYPVAGEGQHRVAPFLLDALPVTNADFVRFVGEHPQWRRSETAPLFADEAYLSHWGGDLELGDVHPEQPVTLVSWFAAAAYCRSQVKRLPSEAEWEHAASPAPGDAAAQQEAQRRILAFYARPRGELFVVGRTPADRFGTHDLHGVIWEWVDDFNASFASADNRQDRDRELARFCGGASVGAADASDYPSFMRYAFRSSLGATFTLHHLGFRCARSLP